MREYKQHIPETPGDVAAQIRFMVLKAPKFEDSFFIGRNVDTVFVALNGGLRNIRNGLGDEQYATLTALSAETRAHFEADPSNTNGRTRQGRKLLYEMLAMLEQRWKHLAPSPDELEG